MNMGFWGFCSWKKPSGVNKHFRIGSSPCWVLSSKMMRNQALIIKIGNGWKWSMLLVPVVVDNLDNLDAEKYLLPAVIILGKFNHDRTLFSRALESWLIYGKSSPFYGRTIQVSDILWPLPRSFTIATNPTPRSRSPSRRPRKIQRFSG